MVLAKLPWERAGANLALASADRTKTTRIGWQLALVGPIRARSKAFRSRSSGTGRSSQ
jgi:hypothetical protein